MDGHIIVLGRQLTGNGRRLIGRSFDHNMNRYIGFAKWQAADTSRYPRFLLVRQNGDANRTFPWQGQALSRPISISRSRR